MFLMMRKMTNIDVVQIMRKIIRDFKSNNSFALRELANDLIKEAVLYNSKLLAELCIIAYVLHKTLTKEHIVKDRHWKNNRKRIIKNLLEMLSYLEEGRITDFEEALASLHNKFEEIDRRFSRFFQSIVDKARIKYASDAYFMGASLGLAAQLTGADKKTLLEYIGATMLYEKEDSVKGINTRLKELKKALGW